jgi:capsule polysaccharide export protein KpsE/RkpR
MENAFVVSVHSKTPQLASDITNYLVGYLNDKIIQLHVAKARDNSLFLSERYEEIKKSLASAEDSLEAFQEKTGIFEATQQAHATIESFAKLESDLAVKQVEYSVLSKVYGENSPTSSNAKISLQEYEKTVNRLKNSQDRSSVVVGLSSLPQKAKYYYKYYRDVKIFDEILGFIVPLYEQSKFDEQRTVPVLQVIDAAVPPEKKSFPPRTIVSLVIASLSLLFVVFFLILRNLLASSTNPKISLIKKDLFHFGNS